MLSDAALIAAAVVVVPLMLVITWYDVRELRIPNWSLVAVFAAFVAIGAWGLPTEVFLWRLGYAAVALVVGFGLYTIATPHVGAGDLKMIAVIAPWLSQTTLLPFLTAYVVLSILGLLTLHGARVALRGRQTGVKALDQRNFFPAGLLLGLSLATVLCLEVSTRFLG